MYQQTSPYHKNTDQKLSEKEQSLIEQILAQEDMLERTTSYMDRIQQQLHRAKQDLEQKNEEFNQSIRYASMIQKAIIPDERVLQQNFRDAFVFHQPKEIIGGDLPFFKKVGDITYVAAIDCTGHGVPGAMLTMVAHAQLNAVIDNEPPKDAGDLLFKLNRQILDSLNHNYNDRHLNDGFDISIIIYNSKSRELDFAGAHNPLYLFRSKEFQKISGTNQSIGGNDGQVSYQNVHVKVEDEDCVYLLSDGYADQFGGKKGKKLKPKRLISLLESVQRLNGDMQHQIVATAFNEWKGTEEQTDDVLLIGLKL